MGKARRKARKAGIWRHRLDWFLREFDLYLAGESTADKVKERADKLKAVRPVKHG